MISGKGTGEKPSIYPPQLANWVTPDKISEPQVFHLQNADNGSGHLLRALLHEFRKNVHVRRTLRCLAHGESSGSIPVIATVTDGKKIKNDSGALLGLEK